LGVVVRMIRLFQNLSICLQTVTQLPLQIAHYRIAHRMAVHGQLTGYHTQAIADPM
jgi:membrane protein insertase Oxa1/YidC/SpoIIIJ